MTSPVAQARKIIQEPNLILFVRYIVDAVKEGWELDDQQPPGLYGYYYETHLLMDENLVPAVKPSRAEILGNARKAKREKKEQALESTETGLQGVENDSEGEDASEPSETPTEPSSEPVDETL